MELDKAQEIRKMFLDALDEASKANKEKTATEDGVKYSLRSEFIEEYDEWDKKDSRIVFEVGRTSDILKSLGVKDTIITWDSSKIIKIKAKHVEMTDTVIKQVPNILEYPIIVMDSKTKEGRLTLMGEVYAKGKPVLAVLELNPLSHKGVELDELKIASAYGKDNAQRLIDNSDIRYIDKNKKRIEKWEKRTRLQLPVGDSYFDSINSISKNSENVNTRNEKFSLKDEKSDSRVEKSSESIDNIPRKRNNKRSYYNEQESQYMIWSNSQSTEIGSTKVFTRFGKQHFYEKTENGIIEISKTQFYEKGEQEYEQSNIRAENSVYDNSDRNGDEQRGHDSSDSLYGHSGEDERNTLYIQEERLQNDLAGNLQRRRTDSEEVRLNEDEKYSLKDESDVDVSSIVDTSSPRYILSEALKGTTLNDAERAKIEEYQANIERLNEQENKLHELKSQIKDISFSSGKRDMQKLRKLKEEATKTENRISLYDKKLTRIESMKPIKQVIDREKSRVRSAEKQKAKKRFDEYKVKSVEHEKMLRENFKASREKAKKEFDGIINPFVSKRFSNVQSDLTTHYVASNSNQIKSADPITYGADD